MYLCCSYIQIKMGTIITLIKVHFTPKIPENTEGTLKGRYLLYDVFL